jgi:hypothetical protein
VSFSGKLPGKISTSKRPSESGEGRFSEVCVLRICAGQGIGFFASRGESLGEYENEKI